MADDLSKFLAPLYGKEQIEWRVETMIRREGTSYPVTRYFHAASLQECFAKIAAMQADKKATILAVTACQYKAKVEYRPETAGMAFGEFLKQNPAAAPEIVPATVLRGDLPVVPPVEPTLEDPYPLASEMQNPQPIATPEAQEQQEEAAAKARLEAIREEIKK